MNLACIHERCQDPCPGSCGYNAECHVISHVPRCMCLSGFEGDPFNGCTQIIHCKHNSIPTLYSISYMYELHT